LVTHDLLQDCTRSRWWMLTQRSHGILFSATMAQKLRPALPSSQALDNSVTLTTLILFIPVATPYSSSGRGKHAAPKHVLDSSDHYLKMYTNSPSYCSSVAPSCSAASTALTASAALRPRWDSLSSPHFYYHVSPPR